MHSTIVIDAVTPMFTGVLPDGARMHLTGTLRHHGGQYLIEQQLTLDSGSGPQWTTPRVHRILRTPATRDVLRASVDQVVTISGVVGCGDTRNRTSIIVDHVQPDERDAFGRLPSPVRR